LPGNKIPRVFINTGIEYLMIVDFVKELASKDDRFVIIQPSKPIRKILEEYGYPFKSKEHSTKLHEWQQGNRETKSMKKYISGAPFQCPDILLYQFSDNFDLKVSQFCCHKLKKEPAKKWAKENKKSITITGMRREEGGQRTTLGCILTDKNGKVVKFHPLAVVSDEWEDWLIEKEKITLCPLYLHPYNFKRTGCAGCPFNLHLQEQLETMSMFLPAERRRCEIIWKKVYDEYRRIGFRLNNNLTIWD
jgi:3'-phosphoadenosine 5'-phosphosulfate sulfotransferase (PAPS reductase)/FAD synthetase